MEILINPVLIKILLLALHLLPVDVSKASMNVIEEGLYIGAYEVVKTADGQLVFQAPKGSEKLKAFEAERSRRYSQNYLVFLSPDKETISIGLTEELKALKPLSQSPHQTVGSEKTSLTVDRQGNLVFIGSETDKILVVFELTVSK